MDKSRRFLLLVLGAKLAIFYRPLVDRDAHRANCKTIFLNWPTSGEHNFSSLFRDIGGNLIVYGGGIMANLI
ncbi:hypothetical protein, partial [Massilia sp. CCM 8734]|uniref:hypothetical protein n=1 Tax=Massilia sp. CCM 8734 TaxID=2609283 RepID=UPI001AAF2108